MQDGRGTVTRPPGPYPARSGGAIAMLHRLLSGQERVAMEIHDPAGAIIEPDGSPIAVADGIDRPGE